MRVYLASPHTFSNFSGGGEFAKSVFEGYAVKVFLAGTYSRPYVYDGLKKPNVYRPYILESFYYCDETMEKNIPLFGDFLLDSGAFTFMQGNGSVDFEEYTEKYADFVNRNNIQKFFELDIDSVVGYENVLKLRTKLEKLTNKQSIPVWHISRGKDEFIRHCQEYPYVAFGGVVINEIKRNQYPVFPWFIKTAHKYGTKIHGLGFTSLEGIRKYHFDSVDSTSWTTGNRFGYVWKFDGKTMLKITPKKDQQIGDSKKLALHNYSEWVKFQIYADQYL